MNFKEILELTATTLTIIVSLIALYGAFKGAKHGFFSKLQEVIHHHHNKMQEEKASAQSDK